MGLGRDPVRTPMQWSAAPHAGFTSGEPWLPVSPDHRLVNVAAQRQDPKSMLALHRALIGLRRRAPALALGSYQPLPAEDDVLAYLRSAGADEPSFLVALNLGSREQRLALPRSGRVALSTHLDRAGERARGTLELRPDEGLIVRLANGD
jgi:alpha-glucosidase